MGFLSSQRLRELLATIRRGGIKRLVPVSILALFAVWWAAGAISQEGEVVWTEALVGDLVISVDVEGTLMSKDSSMLGAPRVENLYDYTITFMAPEGEEVGTGTPVLAFDTTELERRLLERQTASEEASKNLEKLEATLAQQILQQELRLAQAEANLRKAELKADVPEDLSSARELQKARLEVELAEKEVESLKGQIAAEKRAGEAQKAVLQADKDRADRQVLEIEDAIERMTVKAPRSGTVIWVTDWRGEKKAVGDSAWRHEEVIELPNLRMMMAQGEVDEADAGRVAVGQPFRIRLDAHPDVEYTGTVASIWRTVQRKSSSRNPLKVVRLDMELAETDVQRMRPGMRFRGRIETERHESVLMIPAGAVFATADGPVVYRSTILGFERVGVSLGPRNESSVQVLEGLEPGDLVAESNPER
jgi:multidrug efflux pump subunit AcrA (membrane-fusion protein)